jgi:hypothetical protein
MLQAAADNRFNQSFLARNFLESSNAAAMLPFLQQGRQQGRDLSGSLPLGFGGISGLQQLQNQMINMSQLGGRFAGGSQCLPDSLYPQQAIRGLSGNTMIGAPGSGIPLTLPSSTMAPLNSHIASLLGQQSGGGGSTGTQTPVNQEVENALATIAAARGPLPDNSAGPGTIRPDGSHAPVVVYMECDEESLSDYQCLLRKQVELFEA